MLTGLIFTLLGAAGKFQRLKQSEPERAYIKIQ